MVEGRKCTCICHTIKNCVTGNTGQYKLIFAKGMKLQVNSGETKIFLINISCQHVISCITYWHSDTFTKCCKSTLLYISAIYLIFTVEFRVEYSII